MRKREPPDAGRLFLRVCGERRELCYAGRHLKTVDFPTALPSADAAPLRTADAAAPAGRGRWRAAGRVALIAGLLAGLAFVALGWLLTRQHDLCFRVLGWRLTQALSTRYLAAALTLLPQDWDRDGLPDGAEFFWGSSMTDAHDHPGLDAALTDRYYEILFCGERKHLHWRVNALNEKVPVARGFRLMFTSDDPVLLRAGSKGEPIAGPITVTVDEWGGFAIDVLADVPDRELRLQIDNADTGEMVREMCITVVGYPLPAVHPRLLPPVTEATPPALRHELAPDKAILRWKHPGTPLDGYVAEAARDVPGAEWKPFRWCGPEAVECRAAHTAASLFGQPDGPLKWRVVPFLNTRP